MKETSKFILRHYGDSARTFKKTKRNEIKQLASKLDELRFCCNSMPAGAVDLIDEIDCCIEKLEKLTSTKRRWLIY